MTSASPARTDSAVLPSGSTYGRLLAPAHNGGDFRGSLQHLRRELECLYVEVCVATVVGVGDV